jgi:hypothetical protein
MLLFQSNDAMLAVRSSTPFSRIPAHLLLFAGFHLSKTGTRETHNTFLG